MTEEERKEKLAELRAKMSEKRAKKAEEEAKEAKINENIRRKAGKVGHLSILVLIVNTQIAIRIWARLRKT